MGVDRQDQSLSRVVCDAVIRLGIIPVTNQQTILIREGLYPIGPGVQEAEVIGSAQRLVIAQILAEFGNISIKERDRCRTIRASETFIGPAWICLSAVDRKACDLDVVDAKPIADHGNV